MTWMLATPAIMTKSGWVIEPICTETCDAEAPIHLITQVETVLAPTQDVEVTEQDSRQPGSSKAYTRKSTWSMRPTLSADLLAQSAQEDGIELIGPVTKLQDVSWQAREQTGYDISQFKIDWDAKRVTCPHGSTSVKWIEGSQDRTGNAVVHVAFPAASLSQLFCSRPLYAESTARSNHATATTRPA